MGWISPNCAMESASSCNAASSKYSRGCSRLGSTFVMGRVISSDSASSKLSSPNSTPSPVPRPFFSFAAI